MSSRKPWSLALVSKSLSPAPARAAPDWGLASLSGRLVELSGSGPAARLTAAFGLVLEAQKSGEPVAWINLPGSSFFPPDAAEGGVSLESLAVVRVPDARGGARAADQLVRSGGFGLIVLDLEPAQRDLRISTPLLTRLLGLAQKHGTAVVLLTEKPRVAPSVSSLISLRAEASAHLHGSRGEVRVEVLKDKRRGPGRSRVEACHGPAGLC